MNYIFSIVICILIIVAGFFVRKSQNAKIIADYDKEDKTIDKARITKVVGTGVMAIGGTNVVVTIAYIIANKLAGFDNLSVLNWTECFVTVVGAIILVIVAKKKEKVLSRK